MIKVLIADDHEILREGVKRVINEQMGMKVEWEAESGSQLFSILSEETPDLLILDLNMPGRSGLDLLKQLLDMYPALKVLVLTMHPEERFAIRVFKAGAHGYLNKSTLKKDLISAVRKIVIEKRKYISPVVADELAKQFDIDRKTPKHEELSDREFQILCMIASGKYTKEIAQDLFLSPQTIHSYRNRIKEKMNLSSDVEITRYVIEHRLLD